MSSPKHRTALITGANSGLGLEAAAQLAESGYDRVILACRTESKAETARTELIERTGKDVFETLAIDVGLHDTVAQAAANLSERAGTIDFLLLNAGLVGSSTLIKTPHNVELAMAATLVGHHLFTLDLLHRQLLSDEARIVIAGSEAARGDVPTMSLTDVHAFAKTYFDGDLQRAIRTIIRADAPYVYKNMPNYAMAKLFVAWWAAALSTRLPEGMTVNAVSPGSAPATNAFRNQPWLMQVVMSAVMSTLGPLMGMAAPVSVAAGRYLTASQWGPEVNGEFHASAPGKMIGPLHRQVLAHVLDDAAVEATWNVLVTLTDSPALSKVA